MARTPASTDPNAPAETKRKRSSGPRKPSSAHVIFHVTDDAGETIPNAQIKIVHQSKSADAALDFVDANQGKGYVRHKITLADSKPATIEAE